MATAQISKAATRTRDIIGTVISAGKMQKTVTVRLSKEKWNSQVRKNFVIHKKVLVSDPNSSLVEGDVIALAPQRKTSHIKHVVKEIVAPFGLPVEQRPRIPTAAEREMQSLSQRLKRVQLSQDPAQQALAREISAQMEGLAAQRVAAAEAEAQWLTQLSSAIGAEVQSLRRDVIGTR